MLIDDLAYSNKLRGIHPAEKASFALLSMFASMLAKNYFLPLVIVVLNTILVTRFAGIKFKILLKIWMTPLIFGAVGFFAIIFTCCNPDGMGLLGAGVAGGEGGRGIVAISLERENLTFVIQRMLNFLGCVSSLFFLILTTPFGNIIHLLRCLRVPSIFLELVTISHRSIFILMDTVKLMRSAQISRLGYSNFHTSFRSFGLLVSTLLVHSLLRTRRSWAALLARGYQQEIWLLSPANCFHFSCRRLAFGLFIGILLIFVALNF
ncbi:MAG: cobalt ECF transporter T component CbiQ [Oligoflexia bacterium]|nr:cobalt ECF transporter T component CbiQ [Oligoflexia bacterium]